MGKKFETLLEQKVGRGGGIGIREKQPDGSILFLSGDPKILNSAMDLMKEKGFEPQLMR